MQLTKIRIQALACALFLTFWTALAAASEDSQGIDWAKVAKRKPTFKALVLLKGERPLTLRDLASLADAGLIPADRDPGLTVGLKRAIFATTIERWAAGPRLPEGYEGKLLEKFAITGVYRVGFLVKAKEYDGPLTLRVTAPRDGFGRLLVNSDYVIRPECSSVIREDREGNRWLEAAYDRVTEGESIKIHFSFRYLVDMARLLEHTLEMADHAQVKDLPESVQRFLEQGRKIDPSMPEAMAWAERGPQGSPDARLEYHRLFKFLTARIKYDKKKRETYFGGLSVYSDIDEMYQTVARTLATQRGCCPDTVLLECAFLRARGVPCRTAGRFGHFYSMVYAPDYGWLSTSVTPTAIPLIVDPGPDHTPYQSWTPRIPLRTTHWEARIRIEDLEE